MFLSIDTVHFLIKFMTVCLAVLIVEPPVGYFRAWVAKKMGDDTGEQLGYMTLDPFVHIDPLGLFMFGALGFGWFNRVPINPHNIEGRFKHARLCAAMFSSLFGYLLVFIVSLLILMIMFGENLLGLQMSSLSSWAGIIGRILIAVSQISLILAVLDLVVSGTLVVALGLSARSAIYTPYLEVIALMAAFLILLLTGDILFEMLKSIAVLILNGIIIVATTLYGLIR